MNAIITNLLTVLLPKSLPLLALLFRCSQLLPSMHWCVLVLMKQLNISGCEMHICECIFIYICVYYIFHLLLTPTPSALCFHHRKISDFVLTDLKKSILTLRPYERQIYIWKVKHLIRLFPRNKSGFIEAEKYRN